MYRVNRVRGLSPASKANVEVDLSGLLPSKGLTFSLSLDFQTPDWGQEAHPSPCICRSGSNRYGKGFLPQSAAPGDRSSNSYGERGRVRLEGGGLRTPVP